MPGRAREKASKQRCSPAALYTAALRSRAVNLRSLSTLSESLRAVSQRWHRARGRYSVAPPQTKQRAPFQSA
eukprot:7469541-Lingulodinium_polyedra.AAC.1